MRSYKNGLIVRLLKSMSARQVYPLVAPADAAQQEVNLTGRRSVLMWQKQASAAWAQMRKTGPRRRQATRRH
jgi:hypothetical protein